MQSCISGEGCGSHLSLDDRPLLSLLASLVLALSGCLGDPLPLQIASSDQPAPLLARLSTGFDNGSDDCENDELERDLYAAWGSPFAVFGTFVTRCEKPDGTDRLVSGPVYDLTENLTIEGCPNPFLNNNDFSIAGPWIITEAGCNDGNAFSYRIVAGEISAGGSVAWETVFEQGDTLDDGLEYVDPRFIIPFVSAGFDGAQPFFAMGIKVKPPGSSDPPSIGIGIGRRNGLNDWSVRAQYRVGEGDLADYDDLGGVGVSIDCPPGSVPGDPDCGIPAQPVLAMMFRDVFSPSFPPEPVTALAEGSFDGSVLRFVARKDDLVPGFGLRTYASLGEGFGFGFGQGGGAFGATDDQGDDYVLRWSYQSTDEVVVAAEGDPLEGSLSVFDRAFGFSYFDGRVAFENFEESGAAQQLVYESGLPGSMGRLRTLFRSGVDVVANETITDVDIFIRGFDQRVMLNGVALSIADRPLMATPIDSFEALDTIATPVYGGVASGVMLRVLRGQREVEQSFDLGFEPLDALALTPGGVLLAASSDPIDSPVYSVDRTTHQPQLIANTGLGGIVGLAASETQVYATNGSELHTFALDTGLTGLIGSFQDADENPVTDVSGMAWVPDTGGLVAVSESGSMWQVNPSTADLDLRHQIPTPGGPLRSIMATSSDDFAVGADDGRIFQIGISASFGGGSGGGYGSGPVLPEVALQTILDTGDAPVSALTAEAVPEPGAGVLAGVALACVVALRKREPFR